MIKTIKQACIFNPVIHDYRMSQGIENLADLIKDEGDGREFFFRNYVTHGMDQLFREGMLRLSGKSDQAVFELTQAMGGGKTHMMVALGLLARHSHLRPEVLAPELNARVDFADARIAAFNGRNNPDNYIWGEIASQLGQEEAIKPYWVNGRSCTSTLRIIPWVPKPGKMAPLHHYVRGPCHASTPRLLSIGDPCPALAMRYAALSLDEPTRWDAQETS